jgi:four helix bundle protein
MKIPVMLLELSHKKLIAWQKAISLLPLIYAVCNKLPADEKFNLCAQLKRATLSISNNIAEGAARRTNKDKNHFFTMARSSISEVDNCLTACLVLKFVTEEEISAVNISLVEVFKLVSGLIESNRE